MGQIHVSAERNISAPPEQVYRCLSDYHKHQKFLPPNFSDLSIEQGGVGAGTIISVRMTAGGRSRDYRMQVAEPEPGRVLTESDMNSSLVTTFTVTPNDSGSRVGISTTWQGAGGIGGFFERMFAPRALQKIYNDELDRLDEYLRNPTDS